MNEPSTRRGRARRALQWPVLLWLVIVWCLLWGEFTIGNVVAGLIVGVLVTLVFPLPPLVMDGRPHPVAMLRLLGAFLADLVVSSVEVAHLVLRGGQPENAVTVVPLRTRSELALMVTAEVLSLVPGTLLIEASRRTWTIQLHVLDVRSQEALERQRAKVWRQERRVVEAIGSVEDIARVRQEGEAG